MVRPPPEPCAVMTLILTPGRMNRRKADFKFVYKFLEDDL